MRNAADCVTGILGNLEHSKTKIVHFLGNIDHILICISESTEKQHFLFNKFV